MITKQQIEQFFIAIGEGNIQQVKHLLNAGVDINSIDSNGHNGLMIAAMFSRADIALHLCEKGINLNYIKSNENIWLFAHVYPGNSKLIAYLKTKEIDFPHAAAKYAYEGNLQKLKELDLNSTQYYSLMQYAAAGNHSHILQWLQEKYSQQDYNSDVTVSNHELATYPYMIAAVNNNVDFMREFDKTTAIEVDVYCHVLIFSAMHNQLESLQYAFNSICSKKLIGGVGWAALELVKFGINLLKDTNLRHPDKIEQYENELRLSNALHMALLYSIDRENIAICTFLTDTFATQHSIKQSDNSYISVLVLPKNYNFHNYFSSESHVYIASSYPVKKYALLYAAGRGACSIVEALSEVDVADKSLNVTDVEGNNPLHLALTHHHPVLAQYLLETNPDLLSKTNDDDKTPFIIAAEHASKIILPASKASEKDDQHTFYPKLTHLTEKEKLQHFVVTFSYLLSAGALINNRESDLKIVSLLLDFQNDITNLYLLNKEGLLTKNKVQLPGEIILMIIDELESKQTGFPPFYKQLFEFIYKNSLLPSFIKHGKVLLGDNVKRVSYKSDFREGTNSLMAVTWAKKQWTEQSKSSQPKTTVKVRQAREELIDSCKVKSKDVKPFRNALRYSLKKLGIETVSHDDYHKLATVMQKTCNKNTAYTNRQTFFRTFQKHYRQLSEATPAVGCSSK